MEKAQEALKTLESTLEKYRLNKTRVSPADLEGRYKVSFQKLKEKLKKETAAYLNAYCFSRFRVLKGDSGELVAAVGRSVRERQVWMKASRAVFQDFDLRRLQEIAEEERKKIHELYAEYFNRHICLYVDDSCLDGDNPKPPLIYNMLADKFWDEDMGEWTSHENPPEDAVLIFIRTKEGREC